jgi:flagellar biosynthetic protein FliP
MTSRPRHIAPIAAALLAAFAVLGATPAGAQPASGAGPGPAAPLGPAAPPDPGGPSGVLTPPDAAPHVATPGHAPFISIELGGGADQGLSPVLKIVLLFVALTFVPALFLVMTSFTRIIVVLSLLRQGMGVAQLPPNRVLVALALFLTAFTMAPTFNRVYDEALAPYDNGELTEIQALDAAMGPLRTFMLSHTREADLMLFVEIQGNDRPATAEEVPTLTLVPAFILSELKTAFQMGALLFLPFLIIDIVVASILMSMGMMMLPPGTIALPIKIIVFVAVDGWGLVIRSLAESLTG